MLDGAREARRGVRDELSPDSAKSEQLFAAHHPREMPLPHGKPRQCCQAPSGISREEEGQGRARRGRGGEEAERGGEGGGDAYFVVVWGSGGGRRAAGGKGSEGVAAASYRGRIYFVHVIFGFLGIG